jgi:hypothetical protein
MKQSAKKGIRISTLFSSKFLKGILNIVDSEFILGVKNFSHIN